MTKEQMHPEQLSRLETLARRPFAELSASEKAEFGRLHEARADATARAIVANLNRNVAARG